ncbi:MAG: hypothetical protein Q8J62_04825 [Candidatus Cloacimonadaceae bacterium]|nr:hypothetical protein [Candidatus Cloacimonadaceae bacterium]
MKSAKDKLLMIVNEFPPVGESGVQRPLKHLKYINRAGWQCFVITPGKASKTVIDESLLNEIPSEATIHRTFSLGFGGRSVDQVAELKFSSTSGGSMLKNLFWKALNLLNSLLFPIDKQIGWVPFAYLKALSLIRLHGIRNIYITAFPFSAFLIGIMLKRKLGNKICWVADYRDGWQFEPLLKENTIPFRYAIIERFDRQSLELCDHAVFPTEHIHALYLQKYPWVKTKSSTITNGYDEDDFHGLEAHTFDKFTLLYMGRFFFLHDPLPFIRAIKDECSQDFQFIHIGSAAKEIASKLSTYPIYNYQGYKSHRQALEFALGADANLLILNDDKDSEGVYTGKLFELLRIGKPILALGPKRGLVKDLIEQSNAGEYAYIGSSDEIVTAFKRLRVASKSYHTQPETYERFSRERLSTALMKLYE